MTDTISDPEADDHPDNDLRVRLERLEQESEAERQKANRRIIQAEMKIEAMRAGMVDLDGLTFIDMAQVEMTDDGRLAGGAALIAQLRQAKPWLFTGATSSSLSKAPSSQPPRAKLATEMTDAEYKIARKNIISRSTF